MKRFTFVFLVIAGMVIAGTIIAGLGGSMRTPITQPGFDNIPTMIAMDGDALLIHTTAAETTLYEVTIPRNSLGLIDRIVHLEIEYFATNNTGSDKTIVYRVYYGGSAAVATPADTWTTNAAFRYGKLDIWLVNNGAINSQNLFLRDEGNIYNGGALLIAEPSNTELDLKVTVQFSAASVELWIRRLIAITTQMAP